METRIDYAVGGAILMWELEEMNTVETQGKINILLSEALQYIDKDDTYYKRAINEASSRGFNILQ